MQQRQLEFRTFDDLRAELDHLATGYCERCGNWTLGQACTHLSGAINGSRLGIPFKAPWWARWFLATFVLRRVLRTRRIRPGVKLPSKFEPRAPADEAVAIHELRSAILAFEAHRGPLARHPFFGKLSRDQWHALHLIHAAHHLGFFRVGTIPSEAISPRNQS